MKVQIKHKIIKEVIREVEVCLRGADLRGADLCGPLWNKPS